MISIGHYVRPSNQWGLFEASNQFQVQANFFEFEPSFILTGRSLLQICLQLLSCIFSV